MNNLSERVVKEFVEIVQIDSLSLKEEKMFSYLNKRLSPFNVQIEYQEYSLEEIGIKTGNLIVRIPGNTKNKKKAVFFDAHVDTVEPGIGIKPVIDGNRVRSDGRTILGADDKAGAAAMIIAIEELIKNGQEHGDLYFIFTSGEEIRLLGAQRLDFKNIHADYGFILDSHGKVGGVIVAAPFHYDYEIEIKGKASHAGIAPDQGISAIKTAAKIVSELPQGKITQHSVANVGQIEGGKANNIVPEDCIIKGEFRTHSLEEAKELKELIQSIIDRQKKSVVNIQLTIQEMYKGFSYTNDDPIVKLADQAVRALGVTPRFEMTGGGSNTNIYNQRGIPSVTLAAGMMNLHSTEEYVEIDDLENLTRLVLKIVEMA